MTHLKLIIINHNYKYELENICRLFFPFERVEVFTEPQPCDGMTAVTEVASDGLRVSLTAGGFDKCMSDALKPDTSGDEVERRLAVMLYKLLCDCTGMHHKWGILTGVRPGKLMRRLQTDLGDAAAEEWFSKALMVSDEKIALCRRAAENEERIIAMSGERDFSLYISVPFCPSRCSYCSFVSHSVERSFSLLQDYVSLLLKEIEQTGDIARRLGLRLHTVYFGGGTPTVLSAEQLTAVMAAVRRCFDMSHCAEWTVEAGRPDTITRDKLMAIKAGGATRISINPQTMNDAVLETIGRRHTAQQTVDAFALARECGFDNINMDLIAGLPGDSIESYRDTVAKIMSLGPESVTVHALSMKRASAMTTGGDLPEAERGRLADSMITYGSSVFEQNGYEPYYLYRQSKTVGNLENTGFCKPGTECLYNIYIMDETHSILACGGSAVTKLRAPDGYIERIFNFKYPYEYVNRFDEIIARKSGIEPFYAEHFK